MNFNPPLRELASSSSRAAEPAEGQEEKEEEKETHAKEQERSEQEEIVDTAEDSCRAGVSADPLSLDSAAAASTQEQLKIDDTGLAGDEMQGDQESVKSQLSVQDVQEVQTKLGDGTKHCPARGSHEAGIRAWKFSLVFYCWISLILVIALGQGPLWCVKNDHPIPSWFFDAGLLVMVRTCSVSVYVTWVSQMMLHKPFWSGHHGHVNLETWSQKSFLFTKLIHSPWLLWQGHVKRC